MKGFNKGDGRTFLVVVAAAAFGWIVYTQQCTATEALLVIQGVFNYYFNKKDKEA